MSSTQSIYGWKLGRLLSFVLHLSTSTVYLYRRYGNLLLPEHGRSAQPCKESGAWAKQGCYFGGITLRSGRRDLLCIVTGRWWRNIQQSAMGRR